MNITVAVEILELAAKVGIPAVQAAIAAFDKTEITLEDVQALKGLVQAAESYFAAKSQTTAA